MALARSHSLTASSEMPLTKKARISISSESEYAETVEMSLTHQKIPPIEKPFASIVTIEFGKDLDQKLSIHLAQLMEHSESLRANFELADGYREAYAQMKSFKKQVAELLPPKMPKDSFLGKDVDMNIAKGRKLIILALYKLPLTEYQLRVRDALVSMVDDLFQDQKNWGEYNIKRKDFPPEMAIERLKVMKAHATLAALERLHSSLWRIKSVEEKAAVTNREKAAAQGRVILPEADYETIGPIIHWIYHGSVQHKDANLLCKIHTLADQLGLQQLSSSCLNILASDTQAAISYAANGGPSTQELLNPTAVFMDDDSNSISNVICVVFDWILSHQSPPAILKDMIIGLIVDSAVNVDMSLVEMALEKPMSGELKGDICRALASRLQREASGMHITKYTPMDASIKEETKVLGPTNSDGVEG